MSHVVRIMSTLDDVVNADSFSVFESHNVSFFKDGTFIISWFYDEVKWNADSIKNEIKNIMKIINKGAYTETLFDAEGKIISHETTDFTSV